MATRQEPPHHRQLQFRPGSGDDDSGPLIAKLCAPAALSDSDKHALRAICQNVREFEARRTIIAEGDRPNYVNVILDGWAARYKIVVGGARQITAILIPGDLCDLHVTILGEMDHSIMALSHTKVAQVPHQIMEDLPLDRPALGRALWWSTLVDEATLRAWIVNLGRRDALEGIAHLFCELHARLKLVGMANEYNRFALPMTQDTLADALGLTPVHVNRMLRQLRSDGLIALSGGQLTILDINRLHKLAGFDNSYLHRGRLARPSSAPPPQ
jgi:CRP-like cAMP-binding protein